MEILPTKYVPLDISILGVSAVVQSNIRSNDTVSTLWDRLAEDPRIRTFDRFAAGLTLLFAIGLVEIRGGVLRRAAGRRAPDA